MRPYLDSPDPRVQRSAIECLLHHGDPEIHEVALASFRKMMTDPGRRVEAARMMGEFREPEFSGYLGQLVRQETSLPVIRQALPAAGNVPRPPLLEGPVVKTAL